MVNDIRTLRSYALHRADERSSASRDTLHQWIVEISLSDLGRPSTSDEIVQQSQASLNLPKPMPVPCINRGIELALNQGTIEKVRFNKFRLSEQRHCSILEADKKLDNARQAFKSHVIACIDAAVGHLDISAKYHEPLFDLVESTVQDVFYKYVEEVAYIFNGDIVKNDWTNELKDHEFLDEIIFPALKKTFGDDVVQFAYFKVMDGVKTALKNVPPEAHPYLISMHQRVVHSRILSLDPPLQKFEKKLLEKLHIYLDTNVVLVTLFPLSSADATLQTVVKGLSKLGCNLFISSVTLKELRAQIDASHKRYKRLLDDSWVQTMVLKGNDRPLAFFYKQRQKRSNLDWDLFITPYQNDGLEEILMQEYNILVEDEQVSNLETDSRLPQVGYVIRDTKERHYQSQVRPGIEPKLVNDSAVDHDARNFLLMHLLRDKYPRNEMGSRVWFATLDRPLLKAQYNLAKNFREPVMRSLEAWGELLATFDVPDLTHMNHAEFVTFLVQSRLGLLPMDPDVDTNFLETILSLKISLEIFTSLRQDSAIRVLKRLQEKKEVNELIQAKNAGTLSNDEAHNQLMEQIRLAIGNRKEFEEELSGKVQEITERDKEIAQLTTTGKDFEKRCQALESQNKQLVSQMEELKKVHDRDGKKKVVASIALILGVVIIVVLLFVFTKR